MKLEMGESLFYTWLRHVKNCQFVQNNWKVSPFWQLCNEQRIHQFKEAVDSEFSTRFDVFKQNSTLNQIISQGECDAIGISYLDNSFYAVDIAFHRNGLNYGSKAVTTAKVIEKCARTAMCILAFFNREDGDIVFASPKIGPTLKEKIISELQNLQAVSDNMGFSYRFQLLEGETFKNQIIDQIPLLCDEVDDTAELFLRSVQLLDLFGWKEPINSLIVNQQNISAPSQYNVYKIGQLARVVLRNALENNRATREEVENMLTLEYSNEQFGINYPLLVPDRNEDNALRYYANPLTIYGEEYYMCSQWFETPTNNDRVLLENWLQSHGM